MKHEFTPPKIVLLDADSIGAALISGFAVFFAWSQKDQQDTKTFKQGLLSIDRIGEMKLFGHFKQIDPFRVDRGGRSQNGHSLCWREKGRGVKNG